MKTLRALVLVTFLAACAPVADESDQPGPSSQSAASSAEGADDTGGNGETGAAVSSAPTATSRTVEITAADWAFTPSTITVKKGEKVTLKLKGESGVHGISIPGLSISQRIDLGANVSIDLPTDTAGSYSFSCNVPCGSGHKEMKGTIVIEE